VGGNDAETIYSNDVLALAHRTPGVVCTGFRSGEDLRQLYTHAGVFALASSIEGLSIALLEALSFGLPVVASDIPANRDVGLPDTSYFPLGDTDALARLLATTASKPITSADRERRRAFVARHFDWSSAAAATLDSYRKAVDGRPSLRVVSAPN
jgi:glycosyltransferase involved in cell wall biosynthesis